MEHVKRKTLHIQSFYWRCIGNEINTQRAKAKHCLTFNGITFKGDIEANNNGSVTYRANAKETGHHLIYPTYIHMCKKRNKGETLRGRNTFGAWKMTSDNMNSERILMLREVINIFKKKTFPLFSQIHTASICTTTEQSPGLSTNQHGLIPLYSLSLNPVLHSAYALHTTGFGLATSEGHAVIYEHGWLIKKHNADFVPPSVCNDYVFVGEICKQCSLM